MSSCVLSTEEFMAWIDQRGERREMIDLTGLDLSSVKLTEVPRDPGDPRQRRLLREVKFGVRKEKPAILGTLEFRDMILRDCSFCGVTFHLTDFRGARLDRCDFRYAQLSRATFQDAQISSCDFYRAFFEDGTIFDPALLSGSSFTRAFLSGIVELRKENLTAGRWFSKPSSRRAFAQELSPQEYADFLVATAPDRFEREPEEKLTREERDNRADDLTSTINARHEEAAVVLRRIAALWTGQGAYAYAGWAYVRGKRKERKHANPFRRKYRAALEDSGSITVYTRRALVRKHVDLVTATGRSARPSVLWKRLNAARKYRGELRQLRPRRSLGEQLGSVWNWLTRLWRWVVLAVADGLCAFGEGLGHVVAWLALLVLLPGAVFALTDGVEFQSSGKAAGLGDSLLFSLTELVNAAPSRLHAAAHSVEAMNAIQTLIGVILLGLLGFVLGNKLHSA